MPLILDTTLREGEQTPGVYFPEHVKLEIASQLNKLGVRFIETGHPFVSDEIFHAVKHIARQDYTSLVGAHSRSLKKDIDAALECGVKFIGIFYCVSEDRLQNVFNTDLGTAIRQITETIEYAKSVNPAVLIRFTPEDTVRSSFENVSKSAVAAVQAGADIISSADTTGYMIPRSDRSMYDFVKKLKDEFSKNNVNPKIAVHCHNDRGLALANAIEGYLAGADIIDASVLGLGERAGIVDLATLLGVLAQDYEKNDWWQLDQLVPLYNMVSQYSNIPIPANFPIVGANAFTHCAGVHTHAAQKNPLHYQSLDPQHFGRKMDISLDHMSGISSLQYALELIQEEDLDKERLNLVLTNVKKIGQTGRIVDLAELKMIVNWIKNTTNEN
jgi:2-isopropylmalate synthase